MNMRYTCWFSLRGIGHCRVADAVGAAGFCDVAGAVVFAGAAGRFAGAFCCPTAAQVRITRASKTRIEIDTFII